VIWNLGFVVWGLGFGTSTALSVTDFVICWDLEFGIWNLEFVIWDLEFGIWN